MRGANPRPPMRCNVRSCSLRRSKFAWIAIEVQILSPDQKVVEWLTAKFYEVRRRHNRRFDSAYRNLDWLISAMTPGKTGHLQMRQRWRPAASF